MARIVLPLIVGLAGCTVLVWLGLWQVGRLQWKEAVLADIAARIDAPAVSVPVLPDPDAHRYLPVRVEGRTTGSEIDVLVSLKDTGAGYRVISAFETAGGRRIMVDEGFILSSERDLERPGVAMTVTGNLHWPDEVDGFTPEPDLSDGLFFARDVDAMARVLDTEPVLVVARSVTGTDPRATPLPVTTEGIPNNHLGYAVQWFGLAIVWAGMTAFLIWRIHRRTI